MIGAEERLVVATGEIGVEAVVEDIRALDFLRVNERTRKRLRSLRADGAVQAVLFRLFRDRKPSYSPSIVSARPPC
jgi:hypothetical protein